MKKLVFLLLFPAFTFAQTKTTTEKKAAIKTAAGANMPASGGFTVTGNIQGLADGEVKITATQGDEVVAKAPAKGGEFQLRGAVPEPGLYWLTLGKEQPQYIFLENAAIKISGKQNNIKTLKFEGSQSHTDFLEFRRIFDPLFADLNAIALQLQRTAEDQKQPLLQQYAAAVAKMNNAVGEFISARPSSYVSLFVLTITRQINENISEVEQRLHSLSEPVRTSAMGKDLENYLAFAKVGAVGSEAIEFTQNDVNDKPVSLSSFRGKYVLLDFWASWCKPCRMENPNVVAAYNRFKDKNFTVFSVSLDQHKDPWVKAIAIDKLSWTHVSDLQFWNNAVAQLYHVQSIPQNFLIDPQGKIVAKDLRGEDLERKLCELLGCTK